MKFTLETGKKGLRVRKEILDASGFAREDALDVRGEENAVVILKNQMTAMELVNTIQSLKDLTADLLVYLAKLCGPCTHVVASSVSPASGPCPKAGSLRCSSFSGQIRSAGLCPDSCMDGCPCLNEPPRVCLPDDLLERAGIPNGARLDALAEDGEVVITQAGGFDLRDVPSEMKELFLQTGICLDTLDELLVSGEVVYES